MTGHGSPAEPLAHSVSRSVFWNAVLLPLIAALNLVLAMIVRRSFGLDSGVYDIGIGILTTLLIYSALGIPTSLTKFLPELEASQGRQAARGFLLRAGSIRMIILAVVLVPLNLLAAPLAARYPELGTQGALFLHLISALVVLRAVVELAYKALYSTFNQLAVNVLSLVQAVLDPALTALALWWGWGMAGVFGALVCSSSVLVLLSVARASRTLATTTPLESPAAAGTGRESLLRFAGFTYVYELSLYFAGAHFASIALAAVLRDQQQVALFATGYKTALMTIVIVVSSFRGLYRPMFARLRARGDGDQLRRAFSAMSKVQLALLMPAGIGLAIMIADYLPVLYGPAFVPAVPIGRALVPLLFAETALNLGLIMLSVDERYREVLTAQAVLFLGAPLFLFTAATAGLVPAAVVYGLLRLSAVGLGYRRARRLHGVAFPWAFAARLLPACAMMTAALLVGRGLWPASPLEALSLTGAGVLVYALGLRLTRVIGEQEIELLERARFPGRRWVRAWLVPGTPGTGS